MHHVTKILLFTLMALLAAFPVTASSPYSGNAAKAVQWLSQAQNIDGSWGTSDDVKLLCTVEAVTALQALNQRIPAYYWGVTWLENHNAPTIDYKSRRILALAFHGDYLLPELGLVQSAQMLTSPGNNGWGLTQEYQGTPLDSAMALLASYKLGVTSNIQPALNFLKTAQLTGVDKGWPVAQESSSDPMTTALVINSLVNYTALDPSLATPIANGVGTLATAVTTVSPIQLQSLAALAHLRAGYPANATPLLASIASTQLSNGSWSSDPYATATAARAFAAAMATDLAGLSDIVTIPDQALRAAINAALGKNGMDALTKGDLANLTTLNASGKGISNLTGLQWAVNLTSADLSINKITDTSPINGLPNNPTINLSGNPGGPTPPLPPGYDDAQAVPGLSLPGMIFTVIALIAATFFMSRRKRGVPMSNTMRNILMILTALLLPMQAATAAEKNVTLKKGLDAQQIQQIQAIGQAVLTAKKNAEPDPDVQMLRQQLNSLQKAVTELAGPGGQIGPHISLKTNETTTNAPDQAAAVRQKRENKVRDALNGVRKHRSTLQAASEHDTSEYAPMKRAAAAEVEKLENAVEEMLKSRPEEQNEKLKALKERLTIKYRAPLGERNTGEITPTISTITHHREQ